MPWFLLWFACTEPTPTNLKVEAPGRVALEAPPAPPEPTDTTPAPSWTCVDGSVLQVRVLEDGRLTLQFDGRSAILEPAEPEPGDVARWTLGAASFAFRGAQARFARDHVPMACTTDPWVAREERARDARAVFLAAAADRSWTLEVHPTRLSLEEDGRRASLPARLPIQDDGALVWQEDNAYHELGLRIAPGDCPTGAGTWSHTAVLRLDDRVLRGCALDLRR